MRNNTSTSFGDEVRWVNQIRQMLDEELEDDDNGAGDLPVSIFSVPKALSSSAPDSYAPQQIALGPYHHWRADLWEMERYKLAVAKRVQKHFPAGKNFKTLVEQLVELEWRVRGYYHKFLDSNGETLAWMMALDAFFLLEFLQVYAVRQGKALFRISSRMSHFVDCSGRKSAHNAVLRDVIMLENQLPLFVLKKVLEFQCPSPESAHDAFVSMVGGFCKELFPFKTVEEFSEVRVSDAHHLLDLVYKLILPKVERLHSITILLDNFKEPNDKDDETNNEITQQPNYVKKFLEVIWTMCSRFNTAPVRFFKRLFGFLLNLPWTMISKLPGISILVQLIMCLCFPKSKDSSSTSDGESKSSTHNKPPLIEEIAIPSVRELAKSGIRFAPTTGGVTTVRFDPKTFTLHLPSVSLDVNSEVVLRNLVAYEAAAASGPLVFTRYTELMNGIIDTAEDAMLLRKAGIISNRLKSDEEVADLWNGMSKSIRLTKVPFLDKVIEDVNMHYNGRFSVRAGKLLKRYVFSSWQFLTFFAAIMLLLLMSLQAFCSVYDCTTTFRAKIT